MIEAIFRVFLATYRASLSASALIYYSQGQKREQNFAILDLSITLNTFIIFNEYILTNQSFQYSLFLQDPDRG